MPSAIVSINWGGLDQSLSLAFKQGSNSLPLGSTAITEKISWNQSKMGT